MTRMRRATHRAPASLTLVAMLASCRTMPAATPPVTAATSVCAERADATTPRLIARAGVAAADSTVTQARVRWAVADLLVALNTRQADDLAVRYDWTGSLSVRDDFLARARGTGSSTVLRPDPSGTWLSDAPGRKEQTLCLGLSVQWNNLAGVPTTQRMALRASVIDDGRAAWLSRLQVFRVDQ